MADGVLRAWIMRALTSVAFARMSLAATMAC